MKKIINIFLIIIILMNSLLPYKTYATEVNTNSISTNNSEQTNSGIPDESFSDVEQAGIKDINAITEGQATVNGNKQPIAETGNIFTTVTGIVCGIITIIPKICDSIMTIVVRPYQETSYEQSYNGDLSKYQDTLDEFRWFTIQDLVFGKITLFDVNFFDTTVGDNVKNNPNILMKENVRTWFSNINKIAIIASLLVLIYVGVRMAISTVAEEQAKYKTMLFEWLGSLVILFALPYILIFIFTIADSLLKLVPQVSDKNNFEALLTTNLYDKILGADVNSVVTIVTSTITLFLLTIFQVKFFFKYIIRFIKIGFLIVISPIITITYAIDKKSAYKIWLKELLGAVFMQIVHAIMYTIFVFSAAEIATKAPLITIAFFMALSKGEKIFYALFKIKEQ